MDFQKEQQLQRGMKYVIAGEPLEEVCKKLNLQPTELQQYMSKLQTEDVAKKKAVRDECYTFFKKIVAEYGDAAVEAMQSIINEAKK